ERIDLLDLAPRRVVDETSRVSARVDTSHFLTAPVVEHLRNEPQAIGVADQVADAVVFERLRKRTRIRVELHHVAARVVVGDPGHRTRARLIDAVAVRIHTRLRPEAGYFEIAGVKGAIGNDWSRSRDLVGFGAIDAGRDRIAVGVDAKRPPPRGLL